MTVKGPQLGVSVPACVPIACTWPVPRGSSQELSLPAASQERLLLCRGGFVYRDRLRWTLSKPETLGVWSLASRTASFLQSLKPPWSQCQQGINTRSCSRASLPTSSVGKRVCNVGSVCISARRLCSCGPTLPPSRWDPGPRQPLIQATERAFDREARTLRTTCHSACEHFSPSSHWPSTLQWNSAKACDISGPGLLMVGLHVYRSVSAPLQSVLCLVRNSDELPKSQSANCEGRTDLTVTAATDNLQEQPYNQSYVQGLRIFFKYL